MRSLIYRQKNNKEMFSMLKSLPEHEQQEDVEVRKQEWTHSFGYELTCALFFDSDTTTKIKAKIVIDLVSVSSLSIS